MRSHLLVLALVSPLVACGGDDGITLPDAKVFMDAPVDTMAPCTVMAPAGVLSLGSTAMRRSGDYFVMPTMGPQMGKTVFFIGAGLPGSTATAADVLAFEYVEPTAGGFVTGSAIPFETNGANQAYVAASYIFGDYNSTTKTIAQMMFASSGGITLTNIGKTDGDMITGSVGAVNYREISQMNGSDVAGGCTATVMGLSFALTQMNMPFAPEKLPTDSTELTPADMAFLWSQVERLKSLREQQ